MREKLREGPACWAPKEEEGEREMEGDGDLDEALEGAERVDGGGGGGGGGG